MSTFFGGAKRSCCIVHFFSKRCEKVLDNQEKALFLFGYLKNDIEFLMFITSFHDNRGELYFANLVEGKSNI